MQVQERIYLFWVRLTRSPVQWLSTNILREVCCYLSIDCYLPVYKQGRFGLISVVFKTTTLLQGTEFPRGAMLCYLHKFEVMRLGQEKRTLILNPERVMQVADMAETRYYPGVIRYGDFVYAFGGLRATPASSEKYCLKTDQWVALPAMFAAKSAFTPVPLGGLIYLPEVNEGSSLFEAFDVARNIFTSLEASLPFSDFTSIAFIYKEELIILDDAGRRGSLVLPQEAEFRVDKMELKEIECCAQSGPVVVDRTVYFVQYTSGDLCEFSPNGDTFHITI